MPSAVVGSREFTINIAPALSRGKKGRGLSTNFCKEFEIFQAQDREKEKCESLGVILLCCDFIIYY